MKPKKIVTIGGGTGSFTLLSGLKKYPVDISAIVSMADDGGSTGVLRDELGVLPPGDVRQCLVALSDSSEQLRDLMNYRFEEGGLKGHNFGNLFLSALEKINKNFSKGVFEAAKILNVRGEVIPVTDQDARLFMELSDGTVLKGENEINNARDVQKIGIKKMYFSPNVAANSLALKRIMEADLVIIGPGNHYCSIVPNLLVKGVANALQKTKAKIVYNCNLINKEKHTEHFTLDDYVDEIHNLVGKDIIEYVTFNSGKPSRRLIEKYKSNQELLVDFEQARKSSRTYKVIRTDLLSSKKTKYSPSDLLASTRSFIRHDEDKLAKVLMMVLELRDYENTIREII